MKTAFELIEDNGLTLHGDIEHFAELVRANERERVTKMLNHLYAKAPCGHEETVVRGSLVHCKKCNHCFGVD
jgi:hypothetical protein